MIEVLKLNHGDIFYMSNGYHYVCKCEFISQKNECVKYKDVTEGSLTNGMIRSVNKNLFNSCFDNEEDALDYRENCRQKLANMPKADLVKKFYDKLVEFDLLTEDEKELFGKSIDNIKNTELMTQTKEIEKAKAESSFAIAALAEVKAENEMLNLRLANSISNSDEEKMKELIEKAKNLEINNKALRDSQDKLKMENAKLASDFKDKESELFEAKKNILKCRENSKSLEDKLQKANECVETYLASLSQLKVEKETALLAAKSAKEVLDKLKLESKNTNSQELAKYKNENEEMSRNIAMLRNKVSQLKTSLEEKQKEEGSIDGLIKKNRELIEKNKRLQSERDQALAGCGTAESKEDESRIRDLQIVINQKDSIIKKMMPYKDSLEKLTEENEALKNSLNEKDNIIVKLQEETPIAEAGPAINLDKMDIIKLVGALQTLYDDEDKLLIYTIYNGTMAITNLYLDIDGNDIDDPVSYYGQELIDDFYNKYLGYRGDMSDAEAVNKIIKNLI